MPSEPRRSAVVDKLSKHATVSINIFMRHPVMHVICYCFDKKTSFQIFHANISCKRCLLSNTYTQQIFLMIPRKNCLRNKQPTSSHYDNIGTNLLTSTMATHKCIYEIEISYYLNPLAIKSDTYGFSDLQAFSIRALAPKANLQRK